MCHKKDISVLLGYISQHTTEVDNLVVVLWQCYDACAIRVSRHDAYHMESTKPTDVDKEHSVCDAELQIAKLKAEVDSLRRQLADRDSHIVTIEDSQLQLEKQLSSRVAEISVSIICYLVFVL